MRNKFNRLNEEFNNLIEEKNNTEHEMNRLQLKIKSDKNIMQMRQSDYQFKFENQLRDLKIREKKFSEEAKHYKELYKDLTEKFNDRQSVMVSQNSKEINILKQENENLKNQLKNSELEKNSLVEKLEINRNQNLQFQQTFNNLQNENIFLKNKLSKLNQMENGNMNHILTEFEETKKLLEIYKNKNWELQNEFNKLMKENQNYKKPQSNNTREFYSSNNTPMKNHPNMIFNMKSNQNINKINPASNSINNNNHAMFNENTQNYYMNNEFQNEFSNKMNAFKENSLNNLNNNDRAIGIIQTGDGHLRDSIISKNIQNRPSSINIRKENTYINSFENQKLSSNNFDNEFSLPNDFV